MVDHVAGGKDALDVGRRRARLGYEVAGLVVIELVDEELRRRIVADRDEQPIRRDLADLVRLEVSDSDTGELALLDAERFLDHDRRHELDLLVGAGAIEHDRRGAKLISAVENRDLRRELRQEDRLLHRRVAAADDHDLLVTVERGVADGAVGDAAAVKGALGFEIELPCGRAGGDDHALGAVLVLADPDAKGALREVNARDVVGEELGPELLGLAPELAHQLWAHDALGEAGIVLDVARDHQLPAPLEALDDEWLEVRAGAVERGRIAGGTSADDDQLAHSVVVHISSKSTGPDGGPHNIQRIGPLERSQPSR